MILLLSQRLFGHLLVTSRKSVNTGVFVGQLLRWTPMWPTWNVTSITAINHRKPVRLVFYNCRWFQDALKCHICHPTQHCAHCFTVRCRSQYGCSDIWSLATRGGLWYLREKKENCSICSIDWPVHDDEVMKADWTSGWHGL